MILFAVTSQVTETAWGSHTCKNATLDTPGRPEKLASTPYGITQEKEGEEEEKEEEEEEEAATRGGDSRAVTC